MGEMESIGLRGRGSHQQTVNLRGGVAGQHLVDHGASPPNETIEARSGKTNRAARWGKAGRIVLAKDPRRDCAYGHGFEKDLLVSSLSLFLLSVGGMSFACWMVRGHRNRDSSLRRHAIGLFACGALGFPFSLNCVGLAVYDTEQCQDEERRPGSHAQRPDEAFHRADN